jgi:D-alanyl-D-alanine carboxypeptidase/D-alanyl-D-alanine-endopeptidase (penicillin-binding protein 4)
MMKVPTFLHLSRLNFLKLVCFISGLLFLGNVSAGVFSEKRFGNESAVFVVDQDGKSVYAWNENKPLIPASTIKIATSIAAFDTFGQDYRFKTDFYMLGNMLYVKGYGDPYLTSEELDIIVTRLLEKEVLESGFIAEIVADGSYFPALNVPGREKTNQPYDAPLAAISANFNTINIRKSGSKITSAEPQTPITVLAKKLAAKLPNGVNRINLKNTVNAERYFAELLAAKLSEKGVKVGLSRTGVTPIEAKLIYQHVSSKTMTDAVQAMLFYSNNFIANQLFLQMRANDININFESSASFVTDKLGRYLGPDEERAKAKIIEGSGLSRENQLTAEQLVVMLAQFKPQKELMKSYLDGKAYAKSGTLKGVSNLAGYVSKAGRDYYFVFLFNDPVSGDYRTRLLAELYRDL